MPLSQLKTTMEEFGMANRHLTNEHITSYAGHRPAGMLDGRPAFQYHDVFARGTPSSPRDSHVSESSSAHRQDLHVNTNATTPTLDATRQKLMVKESFKTPSPPSNKPKPWNVPQWLEMSPNASYNGYIPKACGANKAGYSKHRVLKESRELALKQMQNSPRAASHGDGGMMKHHPMTREAQSFEEPAGPMRFLPREYRRTAPTSLGSKLQTLDIPSAYGGVDHRMDGYGHAPQHAADPARDHEDLGATTKVVPVHTLQVPRLPKLDLAKMNGQPVKPRWKVEMELLKTAREAGRIAYTKPFMSLEKKKKKNVLDTIATPRAPVKPRDRSDYSPSTNHCSGYDGYVPRSHWRGSRKISA